MYEGVPAQHTFLEIFIFFMQPLYTSSKVRVRSLSMGGSFFGWDRPFTPPNEEYPSDSTASKLNRSGIDSAQSRGKVGLLLY
jgi:hypothetical protein